MVTNLKGRSYEEQLSDSKNPIMARVVPLRIISLIDANKYAHSLFTDLFLFGLFLGYLAVGVLTL